MYTEAVHCTFSVNTGQYFHTERHRHFDRQVMWSVMGKNILLLLPLHQLFLQILQGLHANLTENENQFSTKTEQSDQIIPLAMGWPQQQEERNEILINIHSTIYSIFLPFFGVGLPSATTVHFLREHIFVVFNKFPSLMCWCNVIHHHRPQNLLFFEEWDGILRMRTLENLV